MPQRIIQAKNYPAGDWYPMTSDNRINDAKSVTAVGAALTGHQGWVQAVAIAPDGKTIVTGGRDGTIRLWNKDGSARGATIAGPGGPISALTFAADGAGVIAGTEAGAVRIYGIDGTPSGDAVTAHQGGVRAIAANAQGFATGGDDGAIKTWSSGAAKLVRASGARVRALSYGADKSLAAAGDDGAVWLFIAGKAPTALRGHQASVSAVAFTGDGKQLLSGGFYDGKLRRWTLGGPQS